MKQLLSLFLFLLPCLALAQYPSNGNQKITLGEQTSADGLVYRGVAADTNVITPFSDTSAYIILDTVNSKFYHYNRTSTYWSVAGGGTSVTTFSGGTTGLTPSTATSGVVTLGGTLAVANGGTGADMSSLPNNYLVRKNSSGVFDTAAIYEAGGNVGVGTTTPAYKLEVSGANAQSLQVTSTNGDLANLHLKSTGNNVWSLSADAVLRFNKDATESMRIDQSNNVGIGTISVTEKLHVVGNARITAVGAGAYSNDLNITSTGVLTTASSSDETFKYNINPIAYGLETILQLKPVSFQWKKGDEHDLGFIAQDAVNIIPEAVDTFWDSSLLFRSNTIIPILTKAIQEQQTLIKALEQRIINLENK
jgi:hypothetical protein